jgi:molybdopterin-guanine dinucleotide biosynthesis protein A
MTETTLAEKTLGVLLAGGLARRMGGGDKPLVRVAGRPLLDHVIGRLRPQVAAWGLPVLEDDLPGNRGPLAGVLVGLDWARAQGAAWLVSVAADTPFIPPDLVARLHAARGPHPIAVACSGGRTQPTVALYATALAPDLRQSLLAGERKIDRWTARHGEGRADWPITQFDPFFNVNTQEDAEVAEALALRAAGAP